MISLDRDPEQMRALVDLALHVSGVRVLTGSNFRSINDPGHPLNLIMSTNAPNHLLDLIVLSEGYIAAQRTRYQATEWATNAPENEVTASLHSGLVLHQLGGQLAHPGVYTYHKQLELFENHTGHLVLGQYFGPNWNSVKVTRAGLWRPA